MILEARCLRRTWFGATLFLAILPLSFVFEAGRMQWLMLRDHPLAAGLAWALAALSALTWIGTRRMD